MDPDRPMAGPVPRLALGGGTGTHYHDASTSAGSWSEKESRGGALHYESVGGTTTESSIVTPTRSSQQQALGGSSGRRSDGYEAGASAARAQTDRQGQAYSGSHPNQAGAAMVSGSRAAGGSLDLSDVKPPQNPLPPGHRLYFDGRDAQLKKQQRVLEIRLEELRRREQREQCTFHPMVSPYARSMRRPRSLSPENRAIGESLRRKQQLATRRQQLAQEELKHCTFRPLTLRLAKLSPDADILRPHLHSELHEDNRQRQQYRADLPRRASALEDNVLYPKNIPKKSDEDVAGIVERLLIPQAPALAPVDPNIREKPSVGRKSQEIAEVRRMTLSEATDVVERLLGRPSVSVARESAAAASSGSTQQQQHRSGSRHESPVEDPRLAHLANLFRQLGEASPVAPDHSTKAFPVMALAEAAVRTQTQADASEIISLLGKARSPLVTESEFVKLALADAAQFGPKAYLYPHRAHSHDGAASEWYGGATPTFAPKLSAKTNELLPHRGKHAVSRSGPASEFITLARKPPNTAEVEARAQQELSECTFEPQLTPYSGPIPPPPGWQGQQPRTRSGSAGRQPSS